jgi:uncharacterized protein (TIGR00297 family)
MDIVMDILKALGLTGPFMAAAVLLVSFVVAFLAYHRGSLTGPAALAASVLSLTLYLSGGLRMVFLLLVFFLSSTFLTHYRKRDKHLIEQDLHEKKGARDTFQVFANGGAALAMSLLNAAYHQDVFLIASAAALAASNADTWASELGLLSREKPVYILSRRPVQAGLSGGVTRVGTTAALAGGLFIGLVFGAMRLFDHLPLRTLLLQVALVTLTGFVGSLIDSILGESLQALYTTQANTSLTERRAEQGVANQLKHGWRWMTNDWVNLISSTGASVLLLVFLFLL